jgi:RNA polymerase sigma-70 factor (ECF subfamily)
MTRAASPGSGIVNVGAVESEAATVARPSADAAPDGADPASRAWLRRLRSDGAERRQAIEELRALLLGAVRFEVRRRRAALPHLRGDDYDDLAEQSADDALVAILAKLDDYRGESRFTTWAYKFALLEAAVSLRRHAWQGREVPRSDEWWPLVADRGASPERELETRDLLRALRDSVDRDLTPHQREVLVAVTLNEVPIDVLAERLNTTRGALYKTLHDARVKLRARLLGLGFAIGSGDESENK